MQIITIIADKVVMITTTLPINLLPKIRCSHIWLSISLPPSTHSAPSAILRGCSSIPSILQYIFKFQKANNSANPIMNSIPTKSNFLQRKKQQKKRTGEQAEAKSKLLAVQKNIQAYLIRRKLITTAIQGGNVQYIIMVTSDLSVFKLDAVKNYIERIRQLPPPRNLLLLKQAILSCLGTGDVYLIAEALAQAKEHCRELPSLFREKLFMQTLLKLIRERGLQLLGFSWKWLRESPYIGLLQPELVFDLLLSSFGAQRMEAEGTADTQISIETVLSVVEFACREKRELSSANSQKQYTAIEALMIHCLKHCCIDTLKLNVEGLSFLVEMLRKGLQVQFQSLIKELVGQSKNQSLLSLVEDEEQLQYFENCIRSQSEFECFCEKTLSKVQQVFQQSKALRQLMLSSQRFCSNLYAYITQIKYVYDDHKIMFVYKFLSDESSLKSAFTAKTTEFYGALNTKLITMDDEDFRADPLFSEQQWKDIIQLCIAKAFEISRKLLAVSNKSEKPKMRERLFARKSETEAEFKVLSNLLNNLNKKCLSTNKIPQQYFVSPELDKYLNTFKFGIGAKTIEMMLKSFPFAFGFGSRVKKLQEFIKADKLNHNRSLFQQQEVDPDLIIEVRRGYEFLDAFEFCFSKDFRKKYKIVFFNEQGLEEEGIDGGGIIKEFINRVLKSSFSEIFGMFYETENNEILPNYYSPLGRECEFVGKIVGKAVYEGINIQQKFAEPFLNLLIGRKNTFEDLQYIDKQIYKSMRSIKKMSAKELQILQQTFTVLDHTPFGEKKIVNLKYINGGGSIGAEVLVTSDNVVDFVMSYADYKCNKQLQQKTRFFRKGFLTVMKSQWLTMFSNQQLNSIISGSHPNYSIPELKNNVVYKDYNQKCLTIIDLWSVLSEFTAQQKSAFLFFVTSCSRPPTMGFAAMKPLICIQRNQQTNYLPTANTCMNVLRLPDYRNKKVLKEKLLYAINAKAGFEFA